MNKLQLTSITLGSALALGSLSAAAGANQNPFEAQTLEQGYQLAANYADESKDKAKEGKCGEGKCGEGACGASQGDDKDRDTKKSKESDDKHKEGKCGEGACGAGH